MKNLKKQPILNLINEFIIDSPAPSNISYIWNFGSLLGVCLIIQIITGVTLAMHYCPSIDLAFTSVEHIMRDVNNGWIIRYMHSNTAAFFFIFIYLHMGKAIYYGSYSKPRILLWYTGIVIFLIVMATAFLGYVLPYGQMSYWGATVITNLFSAIPFIGTDIVQFIWGGFSVSNATLNRFFSLHFLLPFLLAALIVLHLIGLHQHGSNNPLGISSNGDKIPFHPYFSYKDYVTFFLFFLILSLFIFFIPNFMGEPDNYIPGNPLVTPPSIVPEWYFLPFYAILRSIPHKLGGVIAMFAAILILFLLPILDVSKIRSLQFRPFMKFFYWLFIANFFILMWIGANHAEPPFITIGQIATVFYFLYFLFFIPFISILENTLADLSISINSNIKPLFIWSSGSIINDIRLGIKFGYNMPIIPTNVYMFINQPFIRILRFIGGLSVIIWLLSINLNYNIYNIIIYFAILQLVFMFSINILKFFYFIKILLSGKLLIRNSPLNIGTTSTAIFVYCIKGVCVVTVGASTVFGAGLGLDFILNKKIEEFEK